jgi:hypothetical protein
LQDTKDMLIITGFTRGPSAKQPSYLLQPSVWNEQELHAQELNSWRIQSAGFRAARGLGKMQNGERRSRGSRWCARLGRRTTAEAGFCGSTAGGSCCSAARASTRGGGARAGRRQQASRSAQAGAAQQGASARLGHPFYGAARCQRRRPWPVAQPGLAGPQMGPGGPGAGRRRTGSGLRARPR